MKQLDSLEHKNRLNLSNKQLLSLLMQLGLLIGTEQDAQSQEFPADNFTLSLPTPEQLGYWPATSDQQVLTWSGLQDNDQECVVVSIQGGPINIQRACPTILRELVIEQNEQYEILQRIIRPDNAEVIVALIQGYFSTVVVYDTNGEHVGGRSGEGLAQTNRGILWLGERLRSNFTIHYLSHAQAPGAIQDIALRIDIAGDDIESSQPKDLAVYRDEDGNEFVVLVYGDVYGFIPYLAVYQITEDVTGVPTFTRLSDIEVDLEQLAGQIPDELSVSGIKQFNEQIWLVVNSRTQSPAALSTCIALTPVVEQPNCEHQQSQSCEPIPSVLCPDGTAQIGEYVCSEETNLTCEPIPCPELPPFAAFCLENQAGSSCPIDPACSTITFCDPQTGEISCTKTLAHPDVCLPDCGEPPSVTCGQITIECADTNLELTFTLQHVCTELGWICPTDTFLDQQIEEACRNHIEQDSGIEDEPDTEILDTPSDTSDIDTQPDIPDDTPAIEPDQAIPDTPDQQPEPEVGDKPVNKGKDPEGCQTEPAKPNGTLILTALTMLLASFRRRR